MFLFSLMSIIGALGMCTIAPLFVEQGKADGLVQHR